MKKLYNIILIYLLAVISVQAQTSLKEQALEKFKAEHYHEAVDILKEALKETPNDAELYYYLGFFSHYIGSDSRLYSGYGEKYSEQILEYLDKAIELNPNYGDAKYFYGAECTTRAFVGMQNRDLSSIKHYLKKAYKKGAFPKWLTELGRNILNSCEPDAILFMAGDADFNVCFYLQVIENIRNDITILPIGNIDRPWHVKYIKDGFDGVTPKANISLTDNQIMQIRPFKWKVTTVQLDVNKADKNRYNLPPNFKMSWEVYPDFTSTRIHSKVEGEKGQPRTYLSPQRAMLLEIVESNLTQRPIYFTNFANTTFYGGLEKYFQNCGFVSKLAPIMTKDTPYAYDFNSFENLFQDSNFKDFHTVKTDIMPRIYGVAYYNSLYFLEELTKHYQEEKKTDKLNKLETLFKTKLKIDLDSEAEKNMEAIFDSNIKK